MRVYFNLDDTRDELLKDCVTDIELRESSEYIEDLAAGKGVDARSIPDPAPFKIRQLAQACALMAAARNQSRMDREAANNGADAFELKRRVYKSKVDELEAQATADTFTGGKAAGRFSMPMSMPVYRG